MDAPPIPNFAKILKGNPMSKIRPPKTPRHEDPSITIANQECQIRLLLDRVEVLQKERDEFERKYLGQSEMTSSLAGQLGDVQSAYARMQGWKDCAREIIGSIEMPFPLPA